MSFTWLYLNNAVLHTGPTNEVFLAEPKVGKTILFYERTLKIDAILKVQNDDCDNLHVSVSDVSPQPSLGRAN